MSEGQINDATTLVLMDRWVQGTKRNERLIRATWWRDPWGKILRIVQRMQRKRFVHLSTQVGELALRYRGIMYQLFRRAGISEQKWRGCIDEIWQHTQDEVRTESTLSNYKDVPHTLWTACSSTIGYEIDSLKPKFMLRAFVDELPTCDERGALRFIAYGSQEGTYPGDEEALRLLPSAFSLLHGQLLRHLEDLEVLTDSAISAMNVLEIKQPFEELEKWLFWD